MFTWLARSASALATSALRLAASIWALATLASALAWSDSAILMGRKTLTPSCKRPFISGQMIFCLLTIILIGRLSGELSGALYSPDDLQLLCGEGEGG